MIRTFFNLLLNVKCFSIAETPSGIDAVATSIPKV